MSLNTGKPSPRPHTPYHSGRLRFAVRVPPGWQMHVDHDQEGPWTIVGWMSPVEDGARGAFDVNAMATEVLNRNPGLQVTRVGPDGRNRRDPTTPQEYLAQAKTGLSFPALRHESERVERVGNLDAGRLVYSYEGNNGRIRETVVTVFGVGMTYQIIFYAPTDRFSHYMPAFEAMLASFAIGSEPAGPGPDSTAAGPAATPRVETTPVQLFSQGAVLYAQGRFSEAEQAFGRVLAANVSTGLKMTAAYALGLTRRQLGQPVSLPAELASRGEETGCAYLAHTLAAQMVQDGHTATLRSAGDQWEVQAAVGGLGYRLSFASVMGAFMNSGSRLEGDTWTGLGDLTARPDVRGEDAYVADLLRRVSQGAHPPVPLPPAGLLPEADSTPLPAGGTVAAAGSSRRWPRRWLAGLLVGGAMVVALALIGHGISRRPGASRDGATGREPPAPRANTPASKTSTPDTDGEAKLVSGELEGANATTGALTVKVYGLAEDRDPVLKLRIEAGADITDGEKALAAKDLKVGDEVDVLYRIKDGKVLYLFLYR